MINLARIVLERAGETAGRTMIRRPLTCALVAMLGGGAITLAAQTTGNAITGSWVGGFEAGGEFGFYSATIDARDGITGIGSVPMRDLSGPLRVSLEGPRVRIEGPASVVLSGTRR